MIHDTSSFFVLFVSIVKQKQKMANISLNKNIYNGTLNGHVYAFLLGYIFLKQYEHPLNLVLSTGFSRFIKKKEGGAWQKATAAAH